MFIPLYLSNLRGWGGEEQLVDCRSYLGRKIFFATHRKGQGHCISGKFNRFSLYFLKIFLAWEQLKCLHLPHLRIISCNILHFVFRFSKPLSKWVNKLINAMQYNTVVKRIDVRKLLQEYPGAIKIKTLGCDLGKQRGIWILSTRLIPYGTKLIVRSIHFAPLVQFCLHRTGCTSSHSDNGVMSWPILHKIHT